MLRRREILKRKRPLAITLQHGHGKFCCCPSPRVHVDIPAINANFHDGIMHCRYWNVWLSHAGASLSDSYQSNAIKL
jgi:hypothetical protein